MSRNVMKRLIALPLLLASWGCMESAPQAETATNTEATVPVEMIVQESPQVATRVAVDGFDFATVGSLPVELSVVDPRGNPLGDTTISIKAEDGTLLMRSRTDANGRLTSQVSYRLADATLTVEIRKPFYAAQSNAITPLELGQRPHEFMISLDNQGDDEADLPELDLTPRTTQSN